MGKIKSKGDLYNSYAHNYDKNIQVMKYLINLLSEGYDSVDDLLKSSLEKCLELTESKFGFICKYIEEYNRVSLFTYCGDNKFFMNDYFHGIEEDLSEFRLLQTVVISRKPLIVNHVDFPSELFGKKLKFVKRMLSIPIIIDNEIVSILIVGNKSSTYTEADIIQLRLLIEVVWKKVERKIVNDKLKEREKHYRLLYENMSEGQTVNQIIYDEMGRVKDYIILDANNAFRRIFKLKDREVKGCLGSEIHKGYNALNLEICEKVIKSGQSEQFEHHIPSLRKYFTISVYSLENDKFAAIYFDTSKEKIKTKKMIYLNYHDSLTGLHNRLYFQNELSKIGKKYALPVSIIMGDVNGLKITNDVFGHNSGDKLLKKIAKILRKSCSQSDLVARWGGDEFIILLPKAESSIAEAVCKKIKAECLKYTNLPVTPSISLGYATNNGSDDIQKTIKAAEEWMYRHKLLESKSMRSSIINSLSNTLYEKDIETEEHAKRIAKICRKIGDKLDLSERMMDALELISMLHDIGKIAISDDILLKPSSLTEEEWIEIKKHPEIGYRIVQSIPELAHVADEILYHHERWDGKGYPQGLEKSQIPLLSRIVAVADSYDAMTNNRPYKKALSKEEALEEIKREAGKQFDPYIVDVFLDCCK